MMQYINESNLENLTTDQKFYQPKIFLSGVVACAYNPATLEAEFRNIVDSKQVEVNSSSMGGWIV